MSGSFSVESNYKALFENAPVAIWEEDFSQVFEYLEELGDSHGDLRNFLTEHRSVLMECVRRVRVLHVNRIARDFYGAPSAEELASQFEQLFDECTLMIFRDEIVAFREGETLFDAEMYAQAAGGQKRLVKMSVAMLPTENVPWSRVIVTFADLSERQKLESSLRVNERRLREYAAKLRRSNDRLSSVNADLERFAYAAAHDLREPLRNVSLYSQLLTRLDLEGAGTAAATAVKFILESTTRMENLISDLLLFAGTNEPDEKADSDAESALRETLENLAVLLAENNAQVDSGVLPRVAVQQTHLRQIFQNLISNAVKYRDPERDPRISVTAELRNGFVRFFVTDNGIGIDPEYHERIFGIFTRLHGRQVQGNGIGLALCKRIVEKYRGEIQVDSTPGKGSSFVFTLPAA